MSDFDQAFDKKPDSEEESAEGEMKQEYSPVQKMVVERNRVYAILTTKIKAIRTDIGRFTLLMFGDPKNPDRVSKEQTILDEVRHPMTRQHPLSQLVMEYIMDVDNLFVKYQQLTAELEAIIKQLGNALDETIKAYERDVGDEKRKAKEAPDPEREKMKAERDKVILGIYDQLVSEKRHVSYTRVSQLATQALGYIVAPSTVNGVLLRNGRNALVDAAQMDPKGAV